MASELWVEASLPPSTRGKVVETMGVGLEKVYPGIRWHSTRKNSAEDQSGFEGGRHREWSR